MLALPRLPFASFGAQSCLLRLPSTIISQDGVDYHPPGSLPLLLPSSPNGPAVLMQRPQAWLHLITDDHDEIGTPSRARSMLLWVIFVIITLSLLRLGTWQGRIGISAIAMSRPAPCRRRAASLRHRGCRERLASISLPWSSPASSSTAWPARREHTDAAPTSSDLAGTTEVSHPTHRCWNIADPSTVHAPTIKFGVGPPTWLTFPILRGPVHRAHELPRRISRLGIRRDDGRSLDRVLTRFPSLTLAAVALPALSQRGTAPEMTPYDGTPTIKQTCRSSGRPATLFCRSARQTPLGDIGLKRNEQLDESHI